MNSGFKHAQYINLYSPWSGSLLELLIPESADTRSQQSKDTDLKSTLRFHADTRHLPTAAARDAAYPALTEP